MFCLREVQIHCGEYKEGAESAIQAASVGEQAAQGAKDGEVTKNFL